MTLQPRTTVILLLLFLAGCMAVQAEVPPTATKKVVIVFSGQALGELKPCGCSREEDQGGIERRKGYFDQRQPDDAPRIRVDVGDNFKEPSRQGKLKAETMAEAMVRMRYDADVLGEKDLIYGNPFLKSLPDLPWVSAYVNIAGWSPPAYRVKTLPNGLKVALLAVAEPGLFYGGQHSNVTVQDPKEALQHTLTQLKTESPDLTVLLSHMKRDTALALLDTEGIDLVINGHIHDDQHLVDFNPVRKNGKLFVQPGPRGQKLGEIAVTISPDGSKSVESKIIRLGSAIPEAPDMTALYSQYNEGVEALFMESLAAKRKKKQSVYATEATCKTCHPKEHETWSASRHGHAYPTLAKVNKAFDPECLACHTTGFDQAGGFISQVDTPELKNVQCEVCHGPRRDHAQSPTGGFAKEAKNACAQCHVRNHSPNFKYETYWPRIAH